jgi:hypothetical protein
VYNGKYIRPSNYADLDKLAAGAVGGAIAGLTLGKGVPLLTRGISAFRTAFPKVATGIDLALTADGVRNLATENGI